MLFRSERLYFTALYQRGLAELAQASDDNNQRLLATLEAQLAAGQATGADVAIVRVDAQSTRQQLRLARANQETALREFRRYLGLPTDQATQVSGELTALRWRSPIEILSDARIGLPDPQASSEALAVISSWAMTRPDVMAAQSDADVARTGRDLAHANRVPDLQAGPYYQESADGTLFLGFRAQMDLPVINTGKPLERQKMAEYNQRSQAWHQARRRAELEGQAAWERYQTAHANLVAEMATDSETLPDELRRLEEQFAAGEVEVVRVVQARASLIQNSLAQIGRAHV